MCDGTGNVEEGTCSLCDGTGKEWNYIVSMIMIALYLVIEVIVFFNFYNLITRTIICITSGIIGTLCLIIFWKKLEWEFDKATLLIFSGSMIIWGIMQLLYVNY